MLSTNTTEFAAIGFEQLHRDGYPMGVIAVRGTFDLFADGSLQPSANQNLVMDDEFERSSHNSQLLRVNDLVPFKPNTDITVIGYTYPPGGERLQSWQFGISVNDKRHILQCHGLRDWQRAENTWRMSKTKAVDRVPLDYRFAAGSDFAEEKSNPNGANPIGAPSIDQTRPPKADHVPVANIESLSDPVKDPFTKVRPANLSPIPPFWQPRLKFAGGYDKQWLQERKPQLPPDFDYKFYQSASPGMIWFGFMKGDERILLYRMLPGGKDIIFQLPRISLIAQAFWMDNRQVQMALNLDGVHIDMRELRAPWRVDLTWRAWMPLCPTFWKFELHHAALMLEKDLPLHSVGENGPEI